MPRRVFSLLEMICLIVPRMGAITPFVQTPQAPGTPGIRTVTPPAKGSPANYPIDPTNVTAATVGVVTVEARTLLPATKGLPFTTSFKRTVVFLKKKVDPHQYVFIRGGKAGCDNCPIAIRHHVLYGPITSIEGHSAYKVWSTRDDKLDWDGEEKTNQWWYERDGHKAISYRAHNSLAAKDGYGYAELNTYGPDYWMMDVLMDCSRTQDGWFEFKGVVQDLNDGNHGFEWEPDVAGERCGGSIGTKYTYIDQDRKNHYARCGAINVFAYSPNRERRLCLIEEFQPGQQWFEAFNKINFG